MEDGSPMNKYFFLASVLLVLGVGRLSAQSSAHGFAWDADFTAYKTYQWVSIASAQHLDALTADQLVGTLDVELAKKGLKKSPSDKPDLYIGYQVALANKKQLDHYEIGDAYQPPAEATTGTPGETAPAVHSGPLVLYMFDATKNKLVWWGISPKAIDADAGPDKKQKHMDAAIAKLLKNYPPQKKS
jgi:hypothetical protein